MAGVTGLTIAWSWTALACAALVLLVAVTVRPFWRYDTAAEHHSHPARV
ncbi:hypothetical protein [Actinoplanes sp. NPDC051851]